jgi:protein TonB
MNLLRPCRYATPALLLVLVSACTNAPPPSASVSAPPAARIPPPPPAKVVPPVPAPRTRFDSIDEYKVEVARQIMRSNPGKTFSHALPPMLPAIVVVNISVDKHGDVTKVAVQRSRDGQASAVTLAAVKQSGQLPKPLNLLPWYRGSLDFSETFLFNKDYRFQLRSLSGPQSTTL